MKKLIIFLFFISTIVYGQKTNKIVIDYNANYDANYFADTMIYPENDTLSIIIMYCDTSTFEIDLPNTLYYNPHIRWMKGYYVYSAYNENEFLNENKTKISKNIFIWDFKYLKYIY